MKKLKRTKSQILKTKLALKKDLMPFDKYFDLLLDIEDLERDELRKKQDIRRAKAKKNIKEKREKELKEKTKDPYLVFLEEMKKEFGEESALNLKKDNAQKRFQRFFTGFPDKRKKQKKVKKVKK